MASLSERDEKRVARGLPTMEQMRIWRSYVETAEIIRSRLGKQFQSESGISSGDYSIMVTLSEEPDWRLRPSELAERIEWDRSRLSHHLKRMEKRGLVRREICPSDSRGSLIVLTEEGFEDFRRSSVPHLQFVKELFIDAFDDDGLAQVDTVTSTLRTHLGLAPRSPATGTA